MTTKQAVVVGLRGEIGSGKDTAADEILRLAAQLKPLRAGRFAFAQTLRDAIEVLTHGAILAQHTWTKEEKSRPIPEGALGSTLNDLVNRIQSAIVFAIASGQNPSNEIEPKRPVVQKKLPLNTLLEAARRLGCLSASDSNSDLSRTFTTPIMTVGRLLQLFGTEVARELVDDAIWIRPAQWRLDAFDLLIITDVRFPNEFKFVQNAGGLVFEIDAVHRLHDNKNANADIVDDGRSRTHKSEQAMRDIPSSQFTATLDNNGTLADFVSIISTCAWPLINGRLK